MDTLGTLVACVLLADFISGVLHWLEDTYCTSGFPLIGKLVCEPNILHHIEPQAMLTGGFWSRNYIQFGLALVIYGVLAICGYGAWPVAFTLVVLSLSNEIHALNHTTKTNWLGSFLKDTGLIQSQRQHNKHHKYPYDRYYCVITSAVNPCLELVNFWRCLEYLLSLIGIQQKRKIREDK